MSYIAKQPANELSAAKDPSARDVFKLITNPVVILIVTAAFIFFYTTTYNVHISALSLTTVLYVLLGAALYASLQMLSAMRAEKATPEQALKMLSSYNTFTGLASCIERHIKELNEQISELQKNQELLIDRYQILTDNLAAAVIIRNAAGKITYCSPYTEVLTGYAIDEIYAATGDFFLNIIDERDRDIYQRALKIAEAGELYEYQFRYYHKSGLEMWAESRTVPVFNDDGQLAFSLSIIVNVTGRIRYQKQVEEKNRDLRDFTYMVTHDLKAPIFTIKGMAHLIEEDFGPEMPADFREALEHICKAASRLEQLVQSVIEYSRITTGESAFEPVNLHSVLADVENDFKEQFKSAGGTLIIDKDMPDIMGERIRVYQIISNLVGNALKYRSPERKLQLKITKAPSDNKRELTICFTDNGLGIPKDKIEVIFRPFQRAHAGDIEGSGIGLACVKKLLDKLSGNIRVKSQEGVGSTFYVTFKIAQ
ncbi:MAG: PAS domain-containing sensor histidine kinase [Candidatus Dadabacteria bacterium]|nr:MAG: PAS domain-containing sensor histidine kinase [Candidatus Dadabacteria bacterium]